MTSNETTESDTTDQTTSARAGRARRVASRAVHVFVTCVASPVRLARRVSRGAARKPRTTVGALTAIVVFLGAAGGYLWSEQHRAQALAESRMAAVETAARQVPKLLSYDGKSISETLRRSNGVLTPQFREKYSKLVRDVVGPAAKKRNISTKASVTASSVVSADTDEVVCLLFVNQSTTAKQRKSPQVSGSRVRVVLTKQADKWLISQLKPV